MKHFNIALILLLTLSQPLFAGEPVMDRGNMDRGTMDRQELNNREDAVAGQIENSRPGQDYQQGVEKRDEMDIDSQDAGQDDW